MKWKDHGRTGIDGQSQSVVQVHVIEPVVINLQEDIEDLFKGTVNSYKELIWTL